MKYGSISIKLKPEKSQYPISLMSDEIKTIFSKHLMKYHGKNLIITDDYVFELYAKDFPFDKKKNKIFTIPNGEKSKTLEVINQIYNALFEMDADRHTRIIALGGGVIGDIAGFVAATYLRGLPLVQIPTTLLSQIDSSIGGKVGVNLAAKNLIGSFYHPEEVYSDSFFWNTLDERQWVNGMGEVVKYALLLDREYFFGLNDNAVLAQRRVPRVMQNIIKAALMFKTRIVEMDEKENDIRRVLNMGHTLGHAIEAAGNYEKYLHGESVFLGMKAVLYISKKRKMLSNSEYDLIVNLINKFYPEKLYENIKTDDLLILLKKDKKIRDGKNVWVLLKEIGQPAIVNNVKKKEIVDAIETLR